MEYKFWKNVSLLLKAKKMTQEQLCNELDINLNTFKGAAGRNNLLKTEATWKIASFFNIQMEKLLFDDLFDNNEIEKILFNKVDVDNEIINSPESLPDKEQKKAKIIETLTEMIKEL